MHPKISIITASYNSVRTIEQTIASVLCQTYPDIEYIIIDGGSTDGTVEVIEKYADRIAYWVSEPDRGIYHAFNKGVRAATGDYVEFLGSDDALAGPRAIEQIAGYLADDVDILSCCAWFVLGGTGKQRLGTNAYARNPATYHGGMVPHGAMFTKRTLQLARPFDESYRIAADYKFFLQCYYDPIVRIRYIDDIVLLFEADSGGASTGGKACDEEVRRIHEACAELSKGQITTQSLETPWWKNCVLAVTDALGLTARLHNRYLALRYGRLHHCDNPVCRWCHRQM